MLRSFEEMTGKMIVARIPALDHEDMVTVRLHKVNTSGIWVESQAFNEAMLERVGMAASARGLVLFIPFGSVDYIVSSTDSLHSDVSTTLGIYAHSMSEDRLAAQVDMLTAMMTPSKAVN